MGKIFYVMGKSASGKDTIYKKLHSRMPELKTVTMYTTRPIRDGEHNGVEYFFVDPSYLDQCRKDGILIECRTYDTVYGPWSYFTADDGQIDLKTGNYLIMGTLESYGRCVLIMERRPLSRLYIYVEDGLRLRRVWNGNSSRPCLSIRKCAGVFWQMRRISAPAIWNRAT